MKILYTTVLFLILLGCKRNVLEKEMSLMNEMNFVPGKSMKIKNVLPLSADPVVIGTYTVGNDSIISKFEIQSRYSLMVIKLKNIAPQYTLHEHPSGDYKPRGYFSTINEGLYEVNLSPGLFKGNYKVNSIDFFSDDKINCQVNNDTIKSFDLNFSKYAIQINKEHSKVIYGKVEYYGLKKLNANVLIYRSGSEAYIFILTPLKKDNMLIEKNQLYDYLFGHDDVK